MTEQYYDHFSDDAAATLARIRTYGGPVTGQPTGPQRLVSAKP